MSYFPFPFRSQVQINDNWFTSWISNTQKSKRKQQERPFDLVFGHICRSNKCNFHFKITSFCRQFARKLFSLKGSSKMHFINIFIVVEHTMTGTRWTSQISRHLCLSDRAEEKGLAPKNENWFGIDLRTNPGLSERTRRYSWFKDGRRGKQLRYYFAFCFGFVVVKYRWFISFVRMNWRDIGSTSSGGDFSMKTVRHFLHVQFAAIGLSCLFEREISNLAQTVECPFTFRKRKHCIPIWLCIIFALLWKSWCVNFA